MELTLERAKKVLDTLPIGYYTGRKIPVDIGDKSIVERDKP